jgi:hypothetical protein
MLLRLFFASAGLRVLGFKRIYRLLARSAPSAGSGSCRRQLAEARKTAAILQRVNREYALPVGNCLTESLALWRLLIKRGIDARLKIGVRTFTGVFESHAWVECDGQVLNDAADVGNIFTPLDLRPLFEIRGGRKRLWKRRR